MNDANNASEDDMMDQESIPSYKVLRTYEKRHSVGGFEIIIVQGSVLDFCHENGAIVNAANEGCLGGGGVDGAITAAGGKNLAADRKALPILVPFAADRGSQSDEEHEAMESSDDNISTEEGTIGIRCMTGSAVLTGPNEYGTLQVPYVIHAVGPNFWVHSPLVGLQLLINAYQKSLDMAASTNRISEIAFSLLSAGVFRGQMKLTYILLESIKAIRDWKHHESNKIERVYLFGFTDRECGLLVRVGDHLFAKDDSNEETKKRTTTNDTDTVAKDHETTSDNDTVPNTARGLPGTQSPTTIDTKIQQKTATANHLKKTRKSMTT